MKITIVTIFPQLINSFTNNRIFQRALENNIIDLNIVNLRDFSNNKHKSVDDYGFGGGVGMVLKPESFFDFFKKSGAKNIIFPSPQGVKLNNEIAKELSSKNELTFICGHYEGIDERVVEKYVDLEVSIGDYVVSGGELPTMVILDSIIRFIPQFIKKESAEIESFEAGKLDFGVYTRPETIDNLKVPSVLTSGNHSMINQYRKRDSLLRTLIKRPDLISKLPKEDKQFIKNIVNDIL